MTLWGLHPLDLAIVVGYFAVLLIIGRLTSRAARAKEGFFLAGRKLGKFYQFVLSFGHATEPQGAVSTASFVYQQGAAGCWFSFQMVFLNPYYWFMRVWFRRVRLTTMADLFVERFGGRGLGYFYTIFQVVAVCISIGFSSLVAYRIASSLAVKPESVWNTTERAQVEAFREWRQLETAAKTQVLSAEEGNRLKELRERRKQGYVVSYVTALDESIFHIGVFVVIGAYLVFGGMVATVGNHAMQGVLIIVFSVLLVPLGLREVGGWAGLAERVPPEMFNLVGAAGSEQFSLSNVLAIFLISILQINAHSHNMGLSGSARNEMAARFSVTGMYLKRVITIVWALVGLIAIALFGPAGLADPDAVWGELSQRLLGPGLIGLMLSGVLAGTMGLVSVKTLAIASLLVCNVVRDLRPAMTPPQELRVSRWASVAILALGLGLATLMGDFLSIANLALTINLPFGAAILLLFFWRRLTATAVWWAVGLSIIVSLVVPWSASSVPALREAPSLVEMQPAPGGKMEGVYFASVTRVSPDDPASPAVGQGRFNFECWLLGRAGLDVAALTPFQRLTAQFLFDALLPLVALIVVSLLTRRTESGRLDYFYGKLKTPVGETPELEVAAMAETRENPRRFDHTKLFPSSAWEFGRWDRTDAWGFVACCAASAALVGLFAAILSTLQR
jgi:solute:Na+ symporter, SSS family